MRDLERLGTTAYREQFVEMGQKGALPLLRYHSPKQDLHVTG